MRHLMLIFFILLFPVSLSADSIAVISTVQGKVVRVTEGDSVNILFSDNELKIVKLAGIDAPERGQPYFEEAREYLASLIWNKSVSVTSTRADMYGIRVRQIFYKSDINLEMIKAGYAWYKLKHSNELDESEKKQYVEAENNARVKKLGLFQDKKPVQPWQWHK